MNELVFFESKTLRDELCKDEHLEILDRVGRLATLPGTAWATQENAAEFFMVSESAIKMIVRRHRSELAEDGYVVLKKKDVEKLQVTGVEIPNRGLAIFPRRALLRVAMLLRDSDVARAARSYLLDLEERGLRRKDRDVLLKMAEQLSRHSMQIGKNVVEMREQSLQLTRHADKLGELAEFSTGQSDIICAVVEEIYKNRDDMRQLARLAGHQNERIDTLDRRLDAMEEIVFWRESRDREHTPPLSLPQPVGKKKRRKKSGS